ncbi:MAG TPA: signal peptide peptidase SppA [Anaerolineae bacterium]|nr:signal peptide peptidase SppA [Anaerolineae bacterium]
MVEEKKRSYWPWVLGGLILLFLLGLCVFGAVLAVAVGSSVKLGGQGVALIRVEGVITAASMPSPFATGAFSERIIQELKQAANDPRAKAIVVRVNSPGGSVVGSDEIYQAMRQVRKPIVVSMGEVAASGGYYIACAADHIVANPATLTGSIGVIMQIPNAAELFDALGVDVAIIRSGPHKGEGNLFEPLSEEEIAILQRQIDEVFGQFVDVVATGRKMDPERVRELADGRTYTGRQAYELGLVDSLGNLSDAVDKAAELAGIRGKPQIIEYRRPPTLFEALMGVTGRQPMRLSLADLLNLEGAPRFLYLYQGP